jgi:hypothetical protein
VGRTVEGAAALSALWEAEGDREGGRMRADRRNSCNSTAAHCLTTQERS